MKAFRCSAILALVAGCAVASGPQPTVSPPPKESGWVVSGYRYEDAWVERIDAPEFGRKGFPIQVTLHMWLSDGSWSLEDVQVEVNDADRTVKLRPVMKKPQYSHPPTFPPLSPPQAGPMMQKETATATFTPAQLGDYRLIPTRPSRAGASAVVAIIEPADALVGE